MAEALIVAPKQIIGYDTATTLAGQGGYPELNTFMPLITHHLLNAVEWPTGAVRTLAERSAAGIEGDEERWREAVERGLALAVRYDRAAGVSQEPHRTGHTVREMALEQGVLPPEEPDALLRAWRVTEQGL